jgi:hypothetical protein
MRDGGNGGRGGHLKPRRQSGHQTLRVRMKMFLSVLWEKQNRAQTRNKRQERERVSHDRRSRAHLKTWLMRRSIGKFCMKGI